MGRWKYPVALSDEERQQLLGLTRRGRSSAREVTRAHILLKADAGWTNQAIARALGTAQTTVCRMKRRFVEEGVAGALKERPRPGQRPKLDGKGEAHLIALACSKAPERHDHWTLRLLAGKAVELGLVESISHEAIRQRLKKTPSSPGRKRAGAFPW